MNYRKRPIQRLSERGGKQLSCWLEPPAAEALRTLTANGEKIGETVSKALIKMAGNSRKLRSKQ